MDTVTEMNRPLTPQSHEITSPLPASPDQRPARSGWALIAIFMLAFWVRSMVMRNSPIFVDELFEAREPIAQSIIDNLVHFRPDTMLLHVLLTKPMALIGWHPFLLRWISLLAGMLAVPLLYQLGKRLFNSHVGLLAALMLAVLPTTVVASIRTRGYSLIVPLSLMSSIFLLNALESGRLGYWLLFAIGVVLLTYTHAFGVLFVAPAFIYTVWYVASTHPRLLAQDRVRLLRGVLIALVIIVIGIGSLIALMWQSDQTYANEIQFSDNWASEFAPLQLSNLKATLASYLGPLRQTTFSESNRWSLYYYGILILLALSVGLAQRQYRYGTAYLALVALVPMLLITLGQGLVRFHAMSRYLDFTLFAYILLTALGIWWLSRVIGRRRWYLVVGIASTLFATAVAPAYTDLTGRFVTGESRQWTKTAHFLLARAAPDDLILCVARDDRRIKSKRHIKTESDGCLLDLHFYPQLAGRVFSWEKMDFITWQNLLMPGRRCAAVYSHLPHPALNMTCADGKEMGPRVWLVFWQPLPSENAFIWDSSLVEARYGNTRLIRVAGDGDLGASLRKAGEVILADDAISPERSIRNRLALANLYASLGDTNQANALIELNHQQMELVPDDDRGNLVEQAASLPLYLPYLGGSALPETSTRATWGNQIELRGYTVQPHSTADGSYDLTVTTFWRALRPLPKDYTFFLHWRDVRGQTLGQADFLLYNGHMPFWAWPPGHIMREARTLHVPAPEPGTSFRLVAGMYDLATGERLPLQDDSSGENVLELIHWPAR